MKVDDFPTILPNDDRRAASLVRDQQKQPPLPDRSPWQPQRDFELPGTSPGHDYPEPEEDDPSERKKKEDK